jgi:hypothetical protein
MNYMPSLEIAARGDYSVAYRAAANFSTLFINLRTAFCVNRTVCSRSLVQAPVSRGDDSVGILFRNIAGYQK